MPLCFLNITIGIEYRDTLYLKITEKKNKLLGMIGKIWDQHFVHKNQR